MMRDTPLVDQGMSYREIERVTGRARKIIQRECEKMLNDKQ